MTWAPRRGAPRKTPEHDFQKAVMQWLHIALTPPAFATSIDHAGNDRLRGALRKSRGVMAGLADVWVFWPEGVLCLELKAGSNKPSEAQYAMAEKLAKCRIWTFVCRDLEAVEKALIQRLVPLRQRLQPRAVDLARLT